MSAAKLPRLQFIGSAAVPAEVLQHRSRRDAAGRSRPSLQGTGMETGQGDVADRGSCPHQPLRHVGAGTGRVRRFSQGEPLESIQRAGPRCARRQRSTAFDHSGGADKPRRLRQSQTAEEADQEDWNDCPRFDPSVARAGQGPMSRGSLFWVAREANPSPSREFHAGRWAALRLNPSAPRGLGPPGRGPRPGLWLRPDSSRRAVPRFPRTGRR